MIIRKAKCDHKWKDFHMMLDRKRQALSMYQLLFAMRSKICEQSEKELIYIHIYGCVSSTLAWKIPWMEEPGRLWSMGSLRVGHN